MLQIIVLRVQIDSSITTVSYTAWHELKIQLTTHPALTFSVINKRNLHLFHWRTELSAICDRRHVIKCTVALRTAYCNSLTAIGFTQHLENKSHVLVDLQNL